MIEQYIVQPSATIRDAMTCIDKNGKGICLVVDGDLCLIGSISDGDIRRAILKSVNLDISVTSLLDERKKTTGRGPITAQIGTSDAELIRLMNVYEIRQIPIVDDQQHVLDVAFMNDLIREYELPLTAVVMAGGFGTRLRPLTENTPKPMLTIGDRPILERMIEQLKKTGVQRVNLTTHFKPEAISGHFGDGADFGVEIKYVHEDQPLGTAGAIGLVDEVDGPLLVINGDILTHVDFRAMLAFHHKHKADLTVAVRQYDVQVPYGVMECDGARVLGVSEKPKMKFLVNAGIYLLEPQVRQHIPAGERYDMTDLIKRLIQQKLKVVSFPIVEYWLDIGQYPDYEKAQSDVETGRLNR